MNINEETIQDNNDNLKEYKKLVEGLESLFTEFANIKKKQTIRKKEKKLPTIRKETNTSLFNNEIYKSLLKSNHHKGKLILLDEKQPLDENESYQKILELFLEENDPIPSLRKEGDANFYNKYLLLQLYTALSLKERKIYLSGSNNKENINRNFMKNLNMINFDKNNELITPEILEFFNHNILRIEDIYQSNENKNKNEINILNKQYIDENNDDGEGKILKENNNKKIITIEAQEIKQNNINGNNVIINDEIKEPDNPIINSISFSKNFENIDLSNEEYKKIKSINMRKILELEDEKLQQITPDEFQELINEVYSTGQISNKEIENKITGGKGKLFTNEEKSNIYIIPNDLEISINPEEKMENEDEYNKDDIPDFGQEEIKNQQNKTLFFEKEDFEKEFFPNIEENNINNKSN